MKTLQGIEELIDKTDGYDKRHRQSYFDKMRQECSDMIAKRFELLAQLHEEHMALPEEEAEYIKRQAEILNTYIYTLRDRIYAAMDREEVENEMNKDASEEEVHAEQTVNRPAKETKVSFQLDTTQAQKALRMLSDTVSNIKDEYTTDRRYSLAEAYNILKDKDNHYTKMIDVWDLTEWELTTDGETLISQNDEGITAWLPSRDDLLKSTKYRIE
ncbi:hypothetical protein ACWCL1_04935 [Ligilactobacillus sp. LYQ135]